MNTKTMGFVIYGAIVFQIALSLSGCSASSSPDDIENNLPKSESLAPPTPHSQNSQTTSLKGVTQRANYICRATITAVRSAREQYDPQINMVMSHVSINVTKVYKGEIGDRMLFRAFGGDMDGLPYYPSHFPQFHVGEDVIIFLGDFNGGIFTVEHEAGKYTVRNGHIVETGITVEEFENEIMSSL